MKINILLTKEKLRRKASVWHATSGTKKHLTVLTILLAGEQQLLVAVGARYLPYELCNS